MEALKWANKPDPRLVVRELEVDASGEYSEIAEHPDHPERSARRPSAGNPDCRRRGG